MMSMKSIFFDKINIFNAAPLSAFAAEQLCCELNSRVKNIASIAENKKSSNIIFDCDLSIGRDSFNFNIDKSKICFHFSGVRGSIYAVGMFLRKIIKNGSGISLIENIEGNYSPSKELRGHQLGYRTTPNTYDAWSYEDYNRYYVELMYFGVNTVEHIPFDIGYSVRNKLMKYDEIEFLKNTVKTMDELDLNVSLWQPNYDGETDETAAQTRKELYSSLERLDYLFIPGGDPGSLPANELLSRFRAVSKALKEAHPNALLWASAQAPHEYKNWGIELTNCLSKDDYGIDGIIYGPNHDMSLQELRSRLPQKYPLRFYPDITHNVRCEYPVHYYKNDWHYALCTGLSRECSNPRPLEFYKLYKETEKYFVGSVSYSEGITDDVNKFLWSALDYNSEISPENAVADYCRLFFFGTDADELENLIFGLEKNWIGDPSFNNSIESTYRSFRNISEAFPFLNDNWRFRQLLFRSRCDKLLRDRYIFENSLISNAKIALSKGDMNKAKEILSENSDADYQNLRKDINNDAAALFGLIGYQSDVKNYSADSWERGAVLETIDLPITDRYWLLKKINSCKTCEEASEYFDRNKVGKNEFYFSVALDGLTQRQRGEPYFNFKGDNPDVNRGDLPTALFNVYDNYTFDYEVNGLSDNRAYVLHITYLDKRNDNVTEFKIKANDRLIYCGKQFGEQDIEYDKKFCKEGFVSAKYDIPVGTVKGGELALEISESIMGVMICEFSLKLK